MDTEVMDDQFYINMREINLPNSLITSYLTPLVIRYRPYLVKQDAQLPQRPRCRVRYTFGQKWKTGTGR